MSQKDDRHSLSQLIRNFILPWVEQYGMSRVFTAPPAWDAHMPLPAGVTVERAPELGRRRTIRNRRRHYGDSVVREWEWPEEDMNSVRSAKLCFVLGESVSLRVSNYTIFCPPGYGILLPAGTPFSNQPIPVANQDGRKSAFSLLMFIQYRGGLLCWLSQHWYEQGEWQIREDTSSIPYSRVPFYLQQLASEAGEDGLHKQLVTDSLLRIVMAQLHRELQGLPNIATGNLAGSAQPAPAEVKEYSIAQAQEYVHMHIREPLSIEKVARFVCMSRTVFTEQFRLITGKSFTQYVMDRRFEEAERLIAATDLSLRDIGHLVGLKPGRLRDLFQERLGYSPLSYRKQGRNGPAENPLDSAESDSVRPISAS